MVSRVHFDEYRIPPKQKRVKYLCVMCEYTLHFGFSLSRVLEREVNAERV